MSKSTDIAINGREASVHGERQRDRIAMHALWEAVGGAVAVFLALFGLATVLTGSMAAYAGAIIGGILVLKCWGGGWFSRGDRRARGLLIRMGMEAEALCGVAVLVLSLLALFHVDRTVLLSWSLMVCGAGLVGGSFGVSRMYDTAKSLIEWRPSEQSQIRDLQLFSEGWRGLLAIGGAILGLLALMGYFPSLLELCGYLVLGMGLMVNGAYFSRHLWSPMEAA